MLALRACTCQLLSYVWRGLPAAAAAKLHYPGQVSPFSGLLKFETRLHSSAKLFVAIFDVRFSLFFAVMQLNAAADQFIIRKLALALRALLTLVFSVLAYVPVALDLYFLAVIVAFRGYRSMSYVSLTVTCSERWCVATPYN